MRSVQDSRVIVLTVGSGDTPQLDALMVRAAVNPADFTALMPRDVLARKRARSRAQRKVGQLRVWIWEGRRVIIPVQKTEHSNQFLKRLVGVCVVRKVSLPKCPKSWS